MGSCKGVPGDEPLGWSDFVTFFTLSMLYQIVVGPQIQDLKKLFDGYSKISKSTKVPVIFKNWKPCRPCDSRARGDIWRFVGIELLNI